MNSNYHVATQDLVCPYCDKICNPFIRSQPSKKENIECEHCEKKFWIETCVVYSSYSDCSLNKEKHTWKKTSIKTLSSCKNCAQSILTKNAK